MTTIIKALETTSSKVSVQELKIAMKNAIEKCFSAIEKIEHYSVATLLDQDTNSIFSDLQLLCKMLNTLSYTK